MRFVDSHLHLSDYGEAGMVLSIAQSSGTLLLSCSVNLETSAKTVALASKQEEWVRAFVGVHPSKAREDSLVGWLGDTLTVATGVGEIGLDPKYSDAGEKSAQMRVFLDQLDVAEAAGRPVQVHSRNAEAECLDKLETRRLTAVLLHWFNGEPELARAEQKGYYISFGPALLLSRKLQRMAASYSPDLILVESDGPIAFGSLGGAGGPTAIPSVLFRLAELKGTTFDDIAETTTRNALTLLSSAGKVKPLTDSGLGRKIGQDQAPLRADSGAIPGSIRHRL